MGWLTLVLFWLAGTVLRGRRERFGWGALLSGFLVLLCLNLLDPDAAIARVNLERGRETGRLDTLYLRRLSADAVPVLLARLPGLAPVDACSIRAAVLARSALEEGEESSSWNWSRARARRWVAARSALLARNDCRLLRRQLPGAPGRPEGAAERERRRRRQGVGTQPPPGATTP